MGQTSTRRAPGSVLAGAAPATARTCAGPRRVVGSRHAGQTPRAACSRLAQGLRIALSADADAEPFLIHATYQIDSRMHVYPRPDTETAIAGALEGTGSTYREFLDEATEPGRRLAKPQTPLPLVWDEPALIISGMAPGTVARWRARRDNDNNPPEATP